MDSKNRIEREGYIFGCSLFFVINVATWFFATLLFRHSVTKKVVKNPVEKVVSLLLVFSATAHERKKSGKISGKKQKAVKKKSGRIATRPELPAMKQKSRKKVAGGFLRPCPLFG